MVKVSTVRGGIPGTGSCRRRVNGCKRCRADAVVRVMPTRLSLSICLLCTVLAGPAAAGIDTERTDSSVGMLIGGARIGDVGGFAAGLQLGLGRHLGPVYLYGEYDFLSVGETGDAGSSAEPIRGLMHRLGGNLRYEVAGSSNRRDARVRGWLEAGLGRQHVAWAAGGTLDRTDVSLGFGIGGDFAIGKDDTVFGYHYALKTFFARAPGGPAAMTDPTCGGPCDQPTAPHRGLDYGIFFNLDLHWGR
jgi:hypothetical protein